MIISRLFFLLIRTHITAGLPLAPMRPCIRLFPSFNPATSTFNAATAAK